MKKFSYILLALVFALFAYLNLNDPDPLQWLSAYGGTAVLFGLAAAERADRRFSGGLAIALAIWMLTMTGGMIDWMNAGFPSIAEEMQATAPHIEVVREFLGLLIAVLALVGLWWSTPKEARIA
jgi:Transmembrane family 220, helix